MSQLIDTFVTNLIKFRKLKGITQIQLSEMADLSTGMIGQIESRKRNPTLITVQKIADALNIPASDLLKETSESHEREVLKRQVCDLINKL